MSIPYQGFIPEYGELKGMHKICTVFAVSTFSRVNGLKRITTASIVTRFCKCQRLRRVSFVSKVRKVSGLRAVTPV